MLLPDGPLPVAGMSGRELDFNAEAKPMQKVHLTCSPIHKNIRRPDHRKVCMQQSLDFGIVIADGRRQRRLTDQDTAPLAPLWKRR